MPLNMIIVGESTEIITHTVDARWLMAYAAGLGDLNSRYMDTQAHPVVAHPLFPVCLEWPVILLCGNLPGTEQVTPAESARSVHAAHDLHLYRQIHAGERLTTRATVISLSRIRPGTMLTYRLDTMDEAGKPVCRTYLFGISRDVEVIGGDSTIEQVPETPKWPEAFVPNQRIQIPVAEGAAHVYTECARIWNPIHTDRAVAIAAGLPDIILHGTATLALAVTQLVNLYLDGDPARVRRLGGRFTAMVPMPSTLTLEIQDEGHGNLFYNVLTEDGQPAISRGFLYFE